MNKYSSALPSATFSAVVMLSTLAGGFLYPSVPSGENSVKVGVYRSSFRPTHEVSRYNFVDGYTANEILSSAQERFVGMLSSSVEPLGGDFAKVMDDCFMDILA